MQRRIATTTLRALTLVAAIGLGSQTAWAEHRVFDVAGGALEVSQACARQVGIKVDPARSGRIGVIADAANPQEIDQLDVAGGSNAAYVGLRPALHACWTPHPDDRFEPTLVLRITVPAHFPVKVAEAGLGHYTLDAVGPLTVAASGMIDLAAGQVAGDTRLDLSGAGQVTIKTLDAGSLDASLSGTTTLHVLDGHIGHVTVSESGAGHVGINPVVDSARLASSGTGDIVLGGVRGALVTSASGLGRISVANRSVAEDDPGR